MQSGVMHAILAISEKYPQNVRSRSQQHLPIRPVDGSIYDLPEYNTLSSICVHCMCAVCNSVYILRQLELAGCIDLLGACDSITLAGQGQAVMLIIIVWIEQCKLINETCHPQYLLLFMHATTLHTYMYSIYMCVYANYIYRSF